MNLRRIPLVCLSAVVALSLLVACQAFAQEANARISGIVTDPAKAVIVGANVVAVNVETGVHFPTKTNGSGIYILPALPVGDFRIEVEHIGFKSIVAPGITLHTQDALEMNFEMALGSASETMTVNGSMTNDSPAISMTVTHEFVENIPLNGRSFQDLLALAPGAVSSGAGNGMYSINGQRDDSNNFTVDGVAANINTGAGSNLPVPGVPNPAPQPLVAASGSYPGLTALGTTQELASEDSIQEFRIQTSGYSAEYGRQPGGQVEITTRSGTKNFHGTAADYFRNTIFDANNWFAYGQPKEAEHQNDYSGTLGGPLIIPHIYSGDKKTFFFFSYEGLQLLLPGYKKAYALSTAFRSSAAPGVQPFLDAFPLPTLNAPLDSDGITSTIFLGYSSPNSLNSTAFRVDHSFGNRLNIFGRFSTTSSVELLRDSNLQPIHASSNPTGVTLGATLAINSHIVDELRFNYLTSRGTQSESLDSLGGATPFATTLLLPGLSAPAYYAQLAFDIPSTGFNGYQFQLTSNVFRQKQLNLIDSLTWQSGRHTLKFGIDYRRLLPTFSEENDVDFLAIATLAEVQQGLADSAYVESIPSSYPVFQNVSAYVQDQWKAMRRLSISYGVRWDINPPPGARHGIYPLAVTETDNLATMQVEPLGTAVYHTVYHNVAPRLGFAYQISNSVNHPVAIKGGAGLFYDTGQSQGASGNSGSDIGGFYGTGQLPLPLTAASVAPLPIQPLTAPYYGGPFIDPNLKVPYTEEWNLSLSAGLNSKNTVALSYVGNNGKQLIYSQYYPQIDNPNFVIPTIVNNASSSSYQALQLQDQGYLATGLQVVGSYTWSHALDNVSYDGQSTYGPLYGNSDNDIRQVANAALVYSLPKVGKGGILGAMLKGWLVAERFSAQSGSPFDVYQGQYTVAGGSQNLIRPNLTSTKNLYLHGVAGAPGGWRVNAEDLGEVQTDPTTGVPLMLGDLGRNYLHGPNFWNLNSSIQRTLPIWREAGLDFRLDAFNILNHPNFGSIDPRMTDQTFGESASIATTGVANQLYANGAPRSLQLMLKLRL